MDLIKFKLEPTRGLNIGAKLFFLLYHIFWVNLETFISLPRRDNKKAKRRELLLILTKKAPFWQKKGATREQAQKIQKKLALFDNI